MRGAILACGLGLFLAGCNLDPAKSCSSDSDCGAGVCGSQTHTCLASECPSACGANLACVKRACAEVHTSVAITASPEDRGHVGHSVTLTAQLTPPSTVTHVDPAQLLISASDGTDTAEQVTLEQVSGGSDGLYRGTWAPQHDGATYQLTVDPSLAIDGGVSLTAKFTGPDLSVRFLNAPQRQDSNHQDPAMPTAYRRDEHAILEVDATDDLVPSSLTVSVAGTDGVFSLAPQASQFSPCDAGLCGSFDIDLFTPTMNAFRTTFPVQLSGSDILGNSSSADAGINVTRWKWQISLTNDVYSSPAIGHLGELYVGSHITSSTGYLTAISPQGTVDWAVDGGAVDGSPSVGAFDGGEMVYVPFAQASGLNLVALAMDGGTVKSCLEPGDSFSTSAAVMTTSLAGLPLETGVVLSGNSTSSNLLSIRALTSQPGADCPLGPSLAKILPSDSENLITNGVSIFAPRESAASIQNATFVQGGGWDSGTEITVPLVLRTLALADNEIFASSSFSGSLLLSAPLDGGVPASLNDSSVAATWGPVIASDGSVVASADNKLSIIRGQVEQLAYSEVAAQSAAVIADDGEVYVAGKDQVFSRPLGALTSVHWEFLDGGIGEVPSSPTIDCNRLSDGGIGSGAVLYVVTKNGTVLAIAVDSRGISTTAPWPKYQHDPRNTGNATTDLSEFKCP